MSAKFEKQIRSLAKQLPVVYTKTKKTVAIKGSDLIKSGKHQDKGGYDIIPDRIYNNTIVLQLPINHADRIKKAYRAKGEQGVADYMKWAKAAHKWQTAEIEKAEQQQPQPGKTIWEKFKIFIWKIIQRFRSVQTEPLPDIRA